MGCVDVQCCDQVGDVCSFRCDEQRFPGDSGEGTRASGLVDGFVVGVDLAVVKEFVC